jgi:hypothetical protein
MDLNKKQKISLWFGIFIICGMGVYPPWINNLYDGKKYGYEWTDFNWFSKVIWEYEPVSYANPFLFDKYIRNLPERIRKNFVTFRVNHILQDYPVSISSRIDSQRLLIQWICIACLTFGLIVTFHKRAP